MKSSQDFRHPGGNWDDRPEDMNDIDADGIQKWRSAKFAEADELQMELEVRLYQRYKKVERAVADDHCIGV